MNLCFAVGIHNRKPLVRRASGIRVVEYIKYSIREEDTDSIEIVGDLFLPNPEKKSKIFSFIHRGDVSFEALRGNQILARNDFCTAFLEKLYAPSLGCRFERKRGQLLGLSQSDVGPVDVHSTDRYCASLSRQDVASGSNIPFTLYSIEIPGQTFGFVRVRGTIEGETLKKLTNNKTYFDVYGGELLLNWIDREDISLWAASNYINVDSHRGEDYKTVFREFVENSYVEPERYDVVLWSSLGTSPVKSRRLSRDLFLGCEEYTLHGRKIDWYWSRSAHFYVCTYPNGLHLGIKLGKSGTSDRQIAAWRGLK